MFKLAIHPNLWQSKSRVKKTMKDDYSPAELNLILHISDHWYGLIVNDKVTDISPSKVYEILAINCFMDNSTGPYVDALRRAIKAIKKCHPYRGTKEWDKMIMLD